MATRFGYVLTDSADKVKEQLLNESRSKHNGKLPVCIEEEKSNYIKYINYIQAKIIISTKIICLFSVSMLSQCVSVPGIFSILYVWNTSK
jgi:hypothetical protein